MKTIEKSLLGVLSLLMVACGSAEKSNTENTQEPQEPKVSGVEVTYNTDATEMKGYIAYDENMEGKRPGILVVHEWWGHNDYVRERADMLAQQGYVAIAVDMYGEGKQAGHPDDAGKFAGEVFANLDEAKARFDAALETLKNDPHVDASQIAAIGYCFGGSVVLSMADAGYDLDAVAAFHAGLDLPIPPSKDIKAKILVANGADDPFVPAASVASYRAAMDSVGADYKYVAYDGAVHAYTSQQADALGEEFNLPLAYNADADKASWNELMMLLQEIFNK
ncbi:dienelactone hydrolase family protein [Roseivirga sp.]|uniref:dienelactone hydrolase family protein n=1 Tax=Roseivirga sp. TaxID=1964215 RepID=UPI003B51A2B3